MVTLEGATSLRQDFRQVDQCHLLAVAAADDAQHGWREFCIARTHHQTVEVDVGVGTLLDVLVAARRTRVESFACVAVIVGVPLCKRTIDDVGSAVGVNRVVPKQMTVAVGDFDFEVSDIAVGWVVALTDGQMKAFRVAHHRNHARRVFLVIHRHGFHPAEVFHLTRTGGAGAANGAVPQRVERLADGGGGAASGTVGQRHVQLLHLRILAVAEIADTAQLA